MSTHGAQTSDIFFIHPIYLKKWILNIFLSYLKRVNVLSPHSTNLTSRSDRKNKIKIWKKKKIIIIWCKS